MKKAIAIGAVLLGIVAMQAGAAEFGILLDKEIGKAQAFNAGASSFQGGSYDASSPTGIGFRAGYTFLNLKVAELGAAVTYHPKSQDNLTEGGNTIGKFGDQYAAVGVQADWKFLLNLHAGLDYRFEKLTTSADGGSTTLNRPWVKAGVGMNLPTPVVSPFVRLEVAMPLTQPGAPSAGSTDDFRKAMAPSLQVALYGGIRF